MASADAQIAQITAAVGLRVRELRQQRGLRQETLAAQTGIAVRSIRNLEAGSGSTLDTLFRVLLALDVLSMLSPLTGETEATMKQGAKKAVTTVKPATRYKNPSMQKVYDACLMLAADPASELYLSNGGQRTGAIHRCAFWDGYNGITRSAHVIPGTLSSAAYQAGKTFAAEQRRKSKISS